MLKSARASKQHSLIQVPCFKPTWPFQPLVSCAPGQRPLRHQGTSLPRPSNKPECASKTLSKNWRGFELREVVEELGLHRVRKQVEAAVSLRLLVGEGWGWCNPLALPQPLGSFRVRGLYPPTSKSPPQFEAKMQESLRIVTESIKTIRDQLEADSVDMGTETFKSKSECTTWLATHNATKVVYLFVDAVSFLSLCTCDAHESEQDAALSRATTVKIRDTNTYQTAFIGSYSLEVPPLLGKGLNADATRATKPLAAVPTFEDFYPGGGREGVKERLMYYAKDGTKTLDTLLGEAFSRAPLPYVVARSMLLASYAFWDEFCRWIISYHDELLGKSNASTQEVWTLISHCVHAVFKSLRSARACGRAFHSSEGMFWGALQAHQVMNEFNDAKFSGHPKIALILHEHLIHFSNPLSQFEAFKQLHANELKARHEKIDKAQRSANQANANAAGKKRDGQGGDKK